MSTLKNNPTSTTIEALTTLWQRVLQLPSVGTEDNFFDLGGDSATALELFNAIAQTFNQELPPVMIYQAPTIAALASLLEEGRASKFPPVVLLKQGNQAPPVFLTHGLGGTIIDFYQVVRHMATPHPIYGMQAKGVDKVDTPFDRIEDMAQYYLDALREVQPSGPYLLAGFSLGGLVTLEMAQRLSAHGEKVALLALLDAYPHVSQMSGGQRVRFAWQRGWRQIGRFSGLPIRKALSVMTHAFNRDSAGSGDPYLAPVEASLSPSMRRMRESAFVALKRYEPRPYSGKIRFVKAQTATRFPDNPAAVWAKWAGKVEVEAVPGDHLGIMTTHAAELGSVLARYVNEASGQGTASRNGEHP
jgi:acetoacetyl-CoA synthetase